MLEHDAFGVVRVTKTHGGNMTLFGSALVHRQRVDIELSRACLERDLNRDWVHSGDDIVRFSMSESQWAQFVSSMGCGTGTPVTLDGAPPRGTPCPRMPGIEQDPLRDTFEGEFRNTARKASEGVLAAQDRIAGFLKPGAKAPTKKELEELNGLLRLAGEQLAGNMAFMEQSFREAMEGTVAAAKTEIEAFVGTLAMRTGLDALRGGGAAPALLDGTVTGRDGSP
jgi:hypothetical protein